MIKFNKYIELIEFFKRNKPQNTYTERHHIIPKFEGGSKVGLTKPPHGVYLQAN